MSHPFRLIMKNDRVIRGDYWSSQVKPAIGTLIMCHGFKGFKDWGMHKHNAEYFAEKLNVVLFNFSFNGVGENLLEFTELEKFAKETYSRDLEDLEALIGLVRSKGFKNDIEQHGVIEGEVEFERKAIAANSSMDASEPVFLLGHSRGAGVALIHALDHPGEIAGVISWNGITDVDLLTRENKEDIRIKGRGYTLNGRTGQELPPGNRERFDILRRISKADFPIVLIQGTEDFVHLREGSAALVAHNSSIKWIQIPGGNHTFGAVHPYQGRTEPLKQALEATIQAIVDMSQAVR
jgi:pimeloyl-ACP methyl ester carboxylesterase